MVANDTDVDVKAMGNTKLKTPLSNWMKVYFEDAEKVQRYPLPTVCPQVFQKDGFREKVWREIYHNLSFGEMATYGDVAKRCGSEKASQVIFYFLRAYFCIMRSVFAMLLTNN